MNFNTLKKLPTLRKVMPYIPFDRGAGGHRIGLRPLSECLPWFVFDEDEEIQKTMKMEILHRSRARTASHWVAYQGLGGATLGAQDETYTMIWEALVGSYPERRQEFIHALEDAKALLGGTASLRLISTLVQDDLCLLEKKDGEWILTAASVCFPTSWRLEDKIGQSVNWIHTHSDGGPIGSDTFRAAIDITIDRLSPGPIYERTNWFVYRDPVLRHRHGNVIYNPDWTGSEISKYNAGSKLHIRYERQTLRRLPETDAILFTIRVYVDPLRRLKEDQRGDLADFVRGYCLHKHEKGQPWKPWECAMWRYLEERTALESAE